MASILESSKHINKLKRKAIDLHEKIKIIDQWEDECRVNPKTKKNAFALKLGIKETTVATILKNSQSIKLKASQGLHQKEAKRLKTSPYEPVNKALQVWFQQKLSQRFPVSGPCLQMQAKKFATDLSIEGFAASTGDLITPSLIQVVFKLYCL